MINVVEKIEEKSFFVKGNMPDILTFLELEQEKHPKITVSKYIRLKRVEKAESIQFGKED